MLRVGYNADGSWRLFSLRQDFSPAVKVQTEDDITASTVVPGGQLGLDPARSYKLVENCENLLFQRPDDAIHRGYDKQAERDIAAPGTFLSNFEPLTRAEAVAMRDDAVAFSAFSEPMADAHRPVRRHRGRRRPGIRRQRRPTRGSSTASRRRTRATSSSARTGSTPRRRPWPSWPRAWRAGCRRPPRSSCRSTSSPPGAATTRPSGTVPPLCSYNPLHYMELPELFMEFISSMTGKSPSTTGAGSEGALTKGPFNAMPAIIDLNAALLSYVLTGYDGWVSAAGYVGPHVRIDHDFSLLVPELFSRMSPDERDARNLIAEGALERLTDFEHEGRPVAASRLGYRMTEQAGDEVLRADLPPPGRRLQPGDAAPGAAGRGRLRRVGRDDRGHPRAGGPGLLQGRHDRAGRPTAAGAAGDHGRRVHRRRAGGSTRPSSGPCSAARPSSPPTGMPPRLDAKQAAASGPRRRRARGDREVRLDPGQRRADGPAGHARAGRGGAGGGPAARRPASSASSWSAPTGSTPL